MTGRLASGLLVSALLKRVNDSGGIGMVLARGDPQAGAILVIASEKGENTGVFERGIGPSGASELVNSGPRESRETAEIADYWRRRRDRDRDLWVIELDSPFAERFAAETIVDG